MSWFFFEPSAVPVLALATTVHVSILLLRIHRSPVDLRFATLLIPSVILSASPWWLTSPVGLLIGLALHVLWFAACERWVPSDDAAAQTQPRPAERPSTPIATTGTSQPTLNAPRGFVQVPVIGVFPETDDITTFRMARPEGFAFEAGQFASVRVNIDGEAVVRCYSVSSAPESAGYFEISVKRQGLMSGALHASVRPGSMISVMPPTGGFTYPAADDRPLVLLAGGVGITPLMSMLRHAFHADPTRPVTLIYSVHTQRDIVFRDELRLIAHRHPQAKVVITTTRGPHDTAHLSGRINGRMIAEQVQEPSNSIFMICGPGPMIESLESTLVELGVPGAQIRSEAFEAAIASTAAPAEAAGDVAAEAESEFELRLVEQDTMITVTGRDTLLAACEAAGIELPSACRAGVCGTCKARLVNGRVRCDSDLLDEAERADGYILPCVSWPESDCTMEAG